METYMNEIKRRAMHAINPLQYTQRNRPEKVARFGMYPPDESVMVLRMLVKRPQTKLILPAELEWTRIMLEEANWAQERMNIFQPFCYLTVRHGLQKASVNQEAWHVDGFSTRITHLPEQNYIWCDKNPTEYADQNFEIPLDFDPNIHNINLLLQNQVRESQIKSIHPEVMYCFDPYVLHRRVASPVEIERTFVRVSFTPIEIEDCNNTQNPGLPTNYTRDGRSEFRDALLPYPYKERYKSVTFNI